MPRARTLMVGFVASLPCAGCTALFPFVEAEGDGDADADVDGDADADGDGDSDADADADADADGDADPCTPTPFDDPAFLDSTAIDVRGNLLVLANEDGFALAQIDGGHSVAEPEVAAILSQDGSAAAIALVETATGGWQVWQTDAAQSMNVTAWGDREPIEVGEWTAGEGFELAGSSRGLGWLATRADGATTVTCLRAPSGLAMPTADCGEVSIAECAAQAVAVTASNVFASCPDSNTANYYTFADGQFQGFAVMNRIIADLAASDTALVAISEAGEIAWVDLEAPQVPNVIPNDDYDRVHARGDVIIVMNAWGVRRLFPTAGAVGREVRIAGIVAGAALGDVGDWVYVASTAGVTAFPVSCLDME